MVNVRRRALAPLVAVLTAAALLALPARATEEVAAASTKRGVRSLHSSPTIADVDGDGVNEIVVGSLDGTVTVYEEDLSTTPGWPRQVDPAGDGRGAVDSSPTVADLDNDGAVEVIVSAGTTFEKDDDHHGGVVVFDRRGNVRWRFMTEDVLNVAHQTDQGDGWADGVFSTPAVGDVTGDGYPEIVFGAWDRHIYVLRRDGAVIGKFYTDDTVWSSPALYDADGDGRAEIFIGGDSTAGGDFDHQGGVLWALKWHEGALRRFWPEPRVVGDIVQSSPAIGDIDGDGVPEVVVGAGTGFWKHPDTNNVFAWGLDGTAKPGWPRATRGGTFSSPALGDVDGNGVDDVVIGSMDHKVYAFRGNGTTIWSVDPAHGEPGRSAEVRSSPIIADIDGDGGQDVVVGTGTAVYGLDGATGARLFGPAAEWWSTYAAPAYGRFPGGWRVVVNVAHANFDGSFNVTEGMLATFAVAAPSGPAAWPQFRKGAAHTGSSYLPGPPPDDSTGIVTRLSGPDRVRTAIRVSRDGFADGAAGAVVLANQGSFADALAGTPLAIRESAPLLLTPRDVLPSEVLDEIARALPGTGTIYLLGGTGALSATVEAQVRNAGYTTVRLGGVSRFDTAVLVANVGLGAPSTVFLATAHNFADALAGGAAAAKVGGAVLLTDGPNRHPATDAYLLLRGSKVYALGGPAAAAYPSAEAIKGVDRFATAAKVAQKFFPSAPVVGVASGVSFPDALAGGAHIGRKGGPVVLVPADGTMPGTADSYLRFNGAGRAWVYGGRKAVSTSMLRQVDSALR